MTVKPFTNVKTTSVWPVSCVNTTSVWPCVNTTSVWPCVKTENVLPIQHGSQYNIFAKAIVIFFIFISI